MLTVRDAIIFLAGMEFLHTLAHFALNFYMHFPMTTNVGTFTANMNFWAIMINGIITLLLLFWARRIDSRSAT